jgi:adenosylcobinamide-phosphate synthase
VAESSCDSFIAPIFYFLIFGVPGAIAYRVANTFDSMMGYHGKYEYLGKFTARLDDLLNYIPARITAFFIITAAYLSKYNGRKAMKTAFRDHNKTESPNAGWPMSAAAGALDVQLEKVGHYKLGNPVKPLVPETIDSSLGLMHSTFANWVLVCLITGVILIATAS